MHSYFSTWNSNKSDSDRSKVAQGGDVVYVSVDLYLGVPEITTNLPASQVVISLARETIPEIPSILRHLYLANQILRRGHL
ncbi:hypothetical protein M407DRAFT_160309 [Tulasnella calospora MUT 4182]|uniref:Uncharacterized protein n=1 Tax=Tulasnella calospora MUT 4182 TaxID=1051891 RepID=A0A0C3LAB8_9AGAM|nr:hypothetical protein M407DRAFT_160309 [Tulasnella calospora MUT 4182]